MKDIKLVQIANLVFEAESSRSVPNGRKSLLFRDSLFNDI